MSSDSGAANRRAGRPSGPEGDAPRFRRDAEAAAAAAPGAELGRGGTQPGVAKVDGCGTRAGLATSGRGRGRTSLPEAPSDCDEHASERVSAASAKVRRSLLFYLHIFW